MRFGWLVLFFLASQAGAQTLPENSKITSELSKSTNAIEHLKDLEKLGPKMVGNIGLDNTAAFLQQAYLNLGYSSSEIEMDTFTQSGQQLVNVIVTKKGLLDDYIIICAHYDTKNGIGINDNGTGVAATLALARTMAKLSSTRTIKFINFTAEEPGYWGASRYVGNQLKSTQGKLYMLLNLDQLGGTAGGTENNFIYCEQDEIQEPNSNNALSHRITDTLMMLCRTYTSLTPVLTNVELSDYIPFQEVGEVVTGIYQYGNYPFYHTDRDSLKNVDTTSFKEVIKLCMAATLYFGRVPGFVHIERIEQAIVTIYPNPAQHSVTVHTSNFQKPLEYSVYSANGQLVMAGKLQDTKTTVALKNLNTGMYHVTFVGDNGEYFWQRLVVLD
jgi:aminopeptidase YwaD